MNRYRNQAFSAIEISLVILIIGILIAGISSGIDMYRSFDLNRARNLTKNSIVNRINNLELWLETSAENSFLPNQQNQDSPVSHWFNSSFQNTQNKLITQNLVAEQPKYALQAFNNSIPAVRFDGVNDNFPVNVAFMNGANFTIFTVEQRRSVSINKHFFFGGGASGVFHLGYINSSNIRVGQYGISGVNFFDLPISAFNSADITPRIHTFILSATTGKKYWLNGGDTPDRSSNNLALLSNFSGYIGVTEYSTATPYFYQGDIGEIIIFSRELSDKERKDVEKYLSDKFKIPLI